MELKTKGARILYEYWDALRAGRQLPCSTDIDLIDIASILPYVMIYTATDDGDFRFRFFGTALVHAVGADLTGLCISDVMEKRDAVESNRDFKKLLNDPCVAINLYQVTANEGSTHETEHLLLPLANPNGRGIEILCHAKRLTQTNSPMTVEVGSFSSQKVAHQQMIPLAP